MELIIRENIEEYMKDLGKWLSEIKDVGLEEMDSFFTERINCYEEHMSVWKEAYIRFAQLLPDNCKRILDLGCGTGLELDEIWKRDPELSVTGIDCCRSMLDRLLVRHRDKPLEVICEDYFKYDPGKEQWDAVISFESLHHFLPDKKVVLYQKIYEGLKPGGAFVLGDYIACCEEEEALLQEVCREKRKRFEVPENRFVHFDIPLTLEHETRLLFGAGFTAVNHVECINGATIILLEK